MGLAAFPGIHVGDVRDQEELFRDVTGRLSDGAPAEDCLVTSCVSGHSCL